MRFGRCAVAKMMPCQHCDGRDQASDLDHLGAQTDGLHFGWQIQHTGIQKIHRGRTDEAGDEQIVRVRIKLQRRADLGDLTLIDSLIAGNSTSGIASIGGGIYSSATTLIQNSTVSGNSTFGNTRNHFASSHNIVCGMKFGCTGDGDNTPQREDQKAPCFL